MSPAAVFASATWASGVSRAFSPGASAGSSGTHSTERATIVRVVFIALPSSHMLSSPRHANRTLMVCLIACLDGRDAQAQQPAARSPAYKQPMTPWGEPDLRGTWPLNHLISTPFQRPERFGERRFLTDEEFAAAQKSAEDRNTRFLSGAIPQADAGQATRQTSLLVDPPNGRFPALTPPRERALRADARQLQAGADGLRQP